jgi:hypothetical protein
LVALLKTLLIPIIVPDLSPGPQRDELFGAPPEEQVIGFFKIIGRHLPADIVPAAEDLDALGRLWDDVNNLEAFIERERLGA